MSTADCDVSDGYMVTYINTHGCHEHPAHFTRHTATNCSTREPGEVALPSLQAHEALTSTASSRPVVSRLEPPLCSPLAGIVVQLRGYSRTACLELTWYNPALDSAVRRAMSSVASSLLRAVLLLALPPAHGPPHSCAAPNPLGWYCT